MDKEEVTYAFWDSTKNPTDIIVNGFSIKDTIKEVLKQSCLYAQTQMDRDFEIEEISEAIKEEFSIKLRLKQGAEHD